MKAIILRNDKLVEYKEVKAGSPDFDYNNGVYVIEPDGVKRTIHPDKPGKFGSESIYFEKESKPLGVSETDYLDDYVIDNVLKQAGFPRQANVIVSFLGSLMRGLTLGNIALWFIILSIGFRIIQSYIRGLAF